MSGTPGDQGRYGQYEYHYSHTTTTNTQYTPGHPQQSISSPTVGRMQHPPALPALPRQDAMARHQQAIQRHHLSAQNSPAGAAASIPPFPQTTHGTPLPHSQPAPPLAASVQQQLQYASTLQQAEREISMQRHVQEVQEQLRRLEDGQARSRAECEIKDRETETVRQRLDDAQRQQREAERTHAREIAKLQQSQTSTLQPHAQALDMSALRGMIEDVHRERLQLDDVKHLVKSAVGEELAGVARTSDIEAAAKAMGQELTGLSHASAARVQQTLRAELGAAVQKVTSHLPKQQQRLEAPSSSRSMPWQQQRQQQSLRYHSTFGIDELPGDLVSASAPPRQSQGTLPHPHALQEAGRSESTALVRRGAERSVGADLTRNKSPKLSRVSVQSSLTAAALARLPGPAGDTEPRSSNIRHSKSRYSVQPSGDDALARPTHVNRSEGGGSSNALARGKRDERGSSKQSTASVRSSNSTTSFRSSAEAMRAAQSTVGGLQRRDADDHGSTVDVPDDFPDNASQVTAWERRQISRSRPQSTLSSASGMVDQRTVDTIRPRNDRRPELQPVPEEEAAAVVRTSKDVAKKSRR